MKRTATPLLALLALLLAGCGSSDGPVGGPPAPEGAVSAPAIANVPVDHVVATVYGDEINGGELMDVFRTSLGGFGAHLSAGTIKPENTAEFLTDAQSQALEIARYFLVSMHLMAREARDAGMELDEQQLQERFLERQGQFPSDLEFRNHLAQFGYTPEKLRAHIATVLLAEAWSAENAGEITISDEDLKATYERNLKLFEHPTSVWVSHVARIFGLGSSEDTKASEREMIEKAKAELDRGIPFEDVARSYSTAPSAANGGRMYSDSMPPLMEGKMDPAQVPTVIQEVAFRLGEGEVSGIIETQDAFHILRVDKRQEAGTRKFDEVKEDLRAEYVQRKLQAVTQEAVAGLWQAAEDEGQLELADLSGFVPEQPPALAGPQAGGAPAQPAGDTPAEGNQG